MFYRPLINALLISLLTAVSACNAESENAQLSESADTLTEKVIAPKTAAASPAITNTVIMQTSLGDITIGLYGKDAPASVENFLEYANSDFYDGTIFHRVIDGFMVQGGGFDKDFIEKSTRDPIKNEATNKIANTLGTIAMARTFIVDSATSQFFINVADNVSLNHRNTTAQGYGYAVFGKVLKGMDVVDKIKAVEKAPRGPHRDAPKETITILDVKVLDSE